VLNSLNSGGLVSGSPANHGDHMDNISVKILRACYAQPVGGDFGPQAVDSVVTLPENIAQRLIGSGKAVRAAPKQDRKPEPRGEQKG